MTSSIPDSLAAITPTWLTDRLRSGGHDVDVTEIAVMPMPGIVGALGEIGILTVGYGRDTDLPTRMVGKCPLDEDTARMYNRIMQYYPRENGFYRDLADRVPMRVPRCFVNESDPDAERYLLLIEHIDGRGGDILAGTDPATLERLVIDLARMHGTFWGDQTVRDLSWQIHWSEPSFRTGIALCQHSWESFNDAQPGFFPPDLREVLARSWIYDTETWTGRFGGREWTFIHQDYELDNMIFDADGPIILDWQTCMTSFPGLDLGLCLATSHNDETLAHEPALLDLYLRTLAEAGGPTWTIDRLREDLAWAMIFFAATLTIPVMQDKSAFGPKAARAQARFDKFLRGCRDGALRWGTVDVAGPLLT